MDSPPSPKAKPTKKKNSSSIKRHSRSCSLINKHKDEINYFSEALKQLEIDRPHLKSERYNKNKNISSSGNDFRSRRLKLGSQCSSLRSSISSIVSSEGTDLEEVNYSPDWRNKQSKNYHRNKNVPFAINDFHPRRNRLGSQCSSLRSSRSSIISCEDTDHERQNCPPDWRNKKLINHSTYLSNHCIRSWIHKNDDSLISLVLKNKEGFKNLFCMHKRVNDLTVVIELLNRICKMNDPSNKKYLLSFSLTQQFIENMDNYISCILLGPPKDTLKNLGDVLTYYSEIVHIIPSENLDNHNEFLMSALEKIEKCSHIPEEMINIMNELIITISEKIFNQNTQFDVSNLSVLPLSQDINEVPELQSNIIKGPYESPSHYLNAHFKLLKEDFVSNLRSGLQEYQNNLNENKASRIKEVFVYDAIYCGFVKHSRKSNLAISFEINNKKLKKVDWVTSKRLIHGSLLLISNDDFKTYYLALLDDRRIPRSDDKSFVISALVMHQLIKFKKYTQCTIIEPKVFFNPYYQVLKTIKKIEPNNFPMKKYIIEAKTDIINPPIYFNKETNYCIAGNEINPDNITSYEFPEIFALNEFQISALQAALTKEFVIIQGPPGTGKSYLGLKIINILLNNSSAWKKDESPILVICYRNNAVDQILESLIKDGRKIVRLGNQSNNELVKEFCLRNAVRSIHSSPVLRDQISTVKNQIDILKSDISAMQTVIESINDKSAVISIESLTDVLTVTQKQYLSKSNVFEEWLFGGTDECDNNEEFLEDIMNNFDRNSLPKYSGSSYFLLSVTELVKELFDLRDKLDSIYPYYDPESIEQDVLLCMIEILQQYEIKEIFLKKVVNRINLESGDYFDITQLNSYDLFELSLPERWKLYKHWTDLFCKQCSEKIEECLTQINEKQNALDELHDMSDGYKVLQIRPEVIGATTTGAARTRSLLTVIQPKIVIFEEAAEVLESHTITALTEFCEHVIMIGDHQQLRPNPASHTSVVKYKLDISLFERMIKNGIEYFTLNEQHRMRPLISSLVIPQFYPNLCNHSSVESYPDVKGMKDNMFFIDHIIPEDELFDSDSHRNKHEANFLLALADYLLKQGYQKGDITILTFYGAQLFFLQAIRSSYPSLKGVSMEVVDNFQGQENKIILLSLVRSNPFSIGFLSKMNRICVALTRAREGFYLIGNMTTLQGNSAVWKDINETLRKNKVIGGELPLKCKRHGTITNVRTAEDFLPLAFGGCIQICGSKLECGHVCELQCHGSDEDHLGTYSCQKPCERKAGCNIHDCKVLCGLPCPKCDEIIEAELPCGHRGKKECEGGFLPCSSNCTDLLGCGHPCPKECHFPMSHIPNEGCPMLCDKPNVNCPFGHKCQKLCGDECGECVVKTISTLPCGHTVHGKCQDIKTKKCEVLLKRELECGHTVDVECYKFNSEVECTEKILKQLPCGHDIEVPCSGGIIEELICEKSVDKLLPCGHFITIPCHRSSEENLACETLVEKELMCGHGTRVEKCSTPPEDIRCKEKITKIVEECGHEVKIMCYKKTCKAVCKEPCKLNQPCGHPCSGFCGQPCPECTEMVEVDQECGHKGLSLCSEIAERKTTDNDVKLSHSGLICETPCKSILKCGHQCLGTCGKCMQGRLHEACLSTCGSMLMCGHECINNCSLNLHLCDKKCLNRCKHQACKNKCTEACVKCKQPCEWQCEHFRCTNLCWQECNRPICEAPCKELLPCGHNCNGFCGEPCPSLCIICSPEKCSQSKYILLEDCGHIISEEEFSSLISSNIGLFLCPKCQKPQTSSNYIRYYTKKWFTLFPKIRKKVLNKYNNLKGLVFDTKSSLKRLHNLLKFKFNDFEQLKLLLNSIIQSVKTVLLKQNNEICIETWRSLLFVSYYISEAFQLLNETNQANNLYLLSKLNYLSSYLKKWEIGISRDQMYQFKNELYRLLIICKLNETKDKLQKTDQSEKIAYFDEAWKSSCDMKEFNNDEQEKIVSLIKKIDSKFDINLNMFSSKFLSLFDKYYSLTLHRDSWMKCKKKGHIFYFIDKVMPQLNCPTCADCKKEFLF